MECRSEALIALCSVIGGLAIYAMKNAGWQANELATQFVPQGVIATKLQRSSGEKALPSPRAARRSS